MAKNKKPRAIKRAGCKDRGSVARYSRRAATWVTPLLKITRNFHMKMADIRSKTSINASTSLGLRTERPLTKTFFCLSWLVLNVNISVFGSDSKPRRESFSARKTSERIFPSDGLKLQKLTCTIQLSFSKNID